AARTSHAAERAKDPFQDDARLQKAVTVRVSRMPIADLLQRLERELGVPLSAEGDDVGDQKIDLFTHGREPNAAQILGAITHLLNSEGPGGYRWYRSGSNPRYRYTLVRDTASREWEAQHAAE